MIHSNDIEKLKNHLAFTCPRIVSEMMQPVLSPHNITFFYFHREYSDGSLITMSSHESWTHNLFKKGYITNKRKIIIPEFKSNPVNYFLWLPHMWPEKIIDAAINFDIANVIDISIRHENYIDYFGYGARMKDHHMFNYYLSQLDVLENISRQFIVRADALINEFEKNKIIPIICNIGNKNTMLSTRQHQCATYILQGKTSKEIAHQLNLSVRTIESYIEDIKHKFNCKNKTDLILTLSRHLPTYV